MKNPVVSAYIDALRKMTASTGHVYLSTGCLHDNHDYCKSMTGAAGGKRPGECKFCHAKCICPCHDRGA